MVALAGLGALVLALLIGGLAEAGRSSAPYRQAIDLSVADRATLVVADSTRTGAQLTALLDQMAGMSRLGLQQAMDALVDDAQSEADQAAALLPPDPSDGAGPPLVAVLAQRAQAVAGLRRTVDGVLGMAPLPLPGVPSSAGGTGATTNLISASVGSAQLVTVGQDLASADATYRQVRRQWAGLPGHPRLPASRWVTDPRLWDAGPVATLVEEITTSSSLLSTHQVQLISFHVRPDVVPPPPGSGPTPGQVEVPPTSSLSVTAVVANLGQVGESGLGITATLAPVPGGRTAARHQRIDLRPGGSVAVDFAPFSVSPGEAYVLSVTVSTPPGQLDPTGLSGALTVQVASATPPTTVAPTTTTTARPAP